MSDVQRKCTPAEIEQKRRQALEKFRRAQELKKINQKQSSENRLRLPATQDDIVQSGKSQLSDAQRAEIEQKRNAAIERAKANKLITSTKAEDLKKVSPGKATAPSKVAIIQSRINPYLKPQNRTQSFAVNQTNPQEVKKSPAPGKAPPPSKEALGSNRSNPYEKPKTRIVTPAKPTVLILVSLEITSENQFVAKTDGYSEAVINEFKKLKTKAYNQQTRAWSFNISEYDLLVKNMQGIKGIANVEGVPDWVRSQIKKPELTVVESCLEVIEEDLLNSLLKFQREGVCYGIARNGRFLLADDMGLGKTRQALAIADFYKEDWPLLIISTASLRTWWQRQIMDLLPKVSLIDIIVMESSKDSIMSAKVLICSYSSLENNLKRLMLKDFGMVILDESHNIKNYKSKQTVNATSICAKAKHVIMISGTPALSRPAELFPQLHILDPNFCNFGQFTKRFCNGHEGDFGWTSTGSSHLDELNCFLRKKFMIRRTKDEVYSELGGKNRQMVEMKDMKLGKNEAEGMQGFSNQYHSSEGKKKQQKEILLQWYNETAKLKVDAVCRYVEEFLKGNSEKCLIFVHHLCLMSALSDCLSKMKVHFMCIEGSTKPETRDSNVERFQNDPSMRCAVLSMKACSAGITLTAASTVIFAELDWTPSNMIQAEARAHRIGQDRQVTCIYLIAPKTADEVIWKMLQEKQHNLTKAGLTCAGEHLSQNMTKTTFEAGPTSPKSPLITDFFTPNTSTSPSDTFYTCENGQENSDDLLNHIDLAAIEAQEKLKNITPVDDILDGIVFDDDEDFII